MSDTLAAVPETSLLNDPPLPIGPMSYEEFLEWVDGEVVPLTTVDAGHAGRRFPQHGATGLVAEGGERVRRE